MENKYEIYRRLFDNINKNTQHEDMDNYKVNKSAFEKDFNNILALKSVQNTTLDDYIKVKPQIDSVTRRKYTLIFLSQVYNMWKESMELVDTDDEEDEEVKTSRGGGFFTKKKTRKKRKKQSHKKQSHKKQSRKKQSHKKQSHKKQTRKKKDIKFTDTSYPYRNISNQEAINDFLALKK